MRQLLFLFFLLMVFMVKSSFAYPVGHPFPPFKIAGNIYYVGTDDLASYLIVTSKGNILINSNLETNIPLIKASIERLGFKWNNTKILLISHAHLDHAEGSQLIRKQTHAQYMVMAEDVPVIESGGKMDFHYAHDKSMYFPSTRVDKILHDKEQIKLGDIVLTAHLTPGHTPGCTTWSMQTKDNNQSYHVVFVGSLSVNPGYKLTHNKTYPHIAMDYQHAISVLKSLPCDIFLGAHAMYFDLEKKFSQLHQGNKNAFVDPKGYQQYIANKEKEFYAALKEQQN